MLGQARMWSGQLTLRTDDGYLIEAPVQGASVRSESSYEGVSIDSLLDSHHIFTDPQTIIFEAHLKYGEVYTIKDLGVDVGKSIAVKGSKGDDDSLRSALGVPRDARVRYDHKKDMTKFMWTERVVLDG